MKEDLIGFCRILLIAGNITMTNLLGNAILGFDETQPCYHVCVHSRNSYEALSLPMPRVELSEAKSIVDLVRILYEKSQSV